MPLSFFLFLPFLLVSLSAPWSSASEPHEYGHLSPRDAAFACARLLDLETDRVVAEGLDHSAGNFYNPDFLLEFFGPQKNSFTQWLKAVEAGTTLEKGHPAGVYSRPGGFGVAKLAEYPYDSGVSDFYDHATGDFDPTPKNLKLLLNIDTSQGLTLSGNSREATAMRQALLHELDLKLFGLYGVLDHVLEDDWILTETKYDMTILASAFPEAKLELKTRDDWTDFYKRNYPGPPPSPLADFHKVAEVISRDEQTVVVKVRLGKGAEPKNRTQEVIQQMFFITHWQMVQKAYRETGLFANDLKSALYLLDNFVQSVQASSEPQDLYLMYDARAWRSLEYRMERSHRYGLLHQTVGLVAKRWKYLTIPGAFTPFYPVYGMMVEHHQAGPYEFKRLFANENPDPLHFFESLKNLRRLNLKFYREVTLQIPEGTTLEAVSKTESHSKLYQAYGFQVLKTEHNDEWNSPMVTLTQPRDLFLKYLESRK